MMYPGNLETLSLALADLDQDLSHLQVSIGAAKHAIPIRTLL